MVTVALHVNTPYHTYLSVLILSSSVGQMYTFVYILLISVYYSYLSSIYRLVISIHRTNIVFIGANTVPNTVLIAIYWCKYCIICYLLVKYTVSTVLFIVLTVGNTPSVPYCTLPYRTNSTDLCYRTVSTRQYIVLYVTVPYHYRTYRRCQRTLTR